MSDDVDTYASVYVYGPASRQALAEAVADIVGAHADQWCTVPLPEVEVQARESDEYSEERSQEYPVGFYSFPLLLEFDFVADTGTQRAIELVGEVMRALWQRGWAAVAVADYADDLPGEGGLSEGLPWPARRDG